MRTKFGCGCTVEVRDPHIGPVCLTHCPLHAAAPDLLAACERAAAILRPEVEPMAFERQAAYSLLRAALEKARGEQPRRTDR
jgi:hypothetical protein